MSTYIQCLRSMLENMIKLNSVIPEKTTYISKIALLKDISIFGYENRKHSQVECIVLSRLKGDAQGWNLQHRSARLQRIYISFAKLKVNKVLFLFAKRWHNVSWYFTFHNTVVSSPILVLFGLVNCIETIFTLGNLLIQGKLPRNYCTCYYLLLSFLIKYKY